MLHLLINLLSTVLKIYRAFQKCVPGLLSGAPFSDGSLAVCTALCCFATSSAEGAPKLDSTVSRTVLKPSPAKHIVSDIFIQNHIYHIIRSRT